ncbi:DUF3853 family protein [Agriterribacter sp.]|uniref:DUF3853 family protein n=1 Tax=Agriterribacter sp. TaxID=2821509 RepID=UPI002B78C597|nr:DUF3853 family protein [Agriterribacter sp.]HTN08849.1 DUF3853 family protein [Agriterribacter sp.]
MEKEIVISKQSLSDLEKIFKTAVQEAINPEKSNLVQNESQDDPYIYGITGLSHFLKCSASSAQRFKNSGRIPYLQTGRRVLFSRQAVLEAISHPKSMPHGKSL